MQRTPPRTGLRPRTVLALLGASTLAGLWALQPAPSAPTSASVPASPTATVRTSAPPLPLDRASLAVAATEAHAPAASSDTWIENELLVMVEDQAALAALASQHGVTIAASVGRSGYGALDTAALDGDPDALAALRADERLLWSGPHALIRGAGKGTKGGKPTGGTDDGGADTSPTGDEPPPEDEGTGNGGNPWDGLYRLLQWHIDDVGLPTTLPDVSGITVAVLDTGVAYRDSSGKGKHAVRTTAAPSLAGSAIVAPHDFVNGDAHPDDDHFHGTHIATTIAGSGDIMGIAPGVAIMPLKVLDAANTGHELHLVEAIHHAVDNGADIINMSLAFGSGYVPSPAMSAAIQRAHEAGVLMVAAAGNDALARVSFPAASPAVIAVTSVCADGAGGHEPAPYANLGVAADLSAPGGCLDRDVDGDGLPDGILAETISPADPSKIETWMFAGTSQAAAIVSGAAAHALALGADPLTLGLRLRSETREDLGTDSIVNGTGTGTLDIAAVDDHIRRGVTQGYMRKDYGVGLVPWLEDAGSELRPRARLTVVDGKGAPAEGLTVHVSVSGDGTTVQSCVTDRDGHCDIAGPGVPRLDAEGKDTAMAWGISVQAVEASGALYRPEPMLFATDALEGVLRALHTEAGLDYPVLAFEWTPGSTDLGEMADAWSIVDSGAGLSTSPFGVVMTRPVVDSLGTPTEGSLSGTGLSTSPFGYDLLTLSSLTLSHGTGLSTSPFGLQPITIVSFSGSGLSTSPFGIRTVYEDPGEGGEHFTGDPVLLGSGTFTGSSADVAGNTELGMLVGSGGFVSLDGYAGASALTESGSVPVTVGTASGGVQGAHAVRVK